MLFSNNLKKVLLVKGTRIVIPSAMGLKILDKIHEGIEALNCQVANLEPKIAVWWPNLSREIQEMGSNFKICTKHQPEQNQ